MRGAVHLLSQVSYWLAFAAGVGTFTMMVLVGADVLLRFSGSGLPATLEIVANYLMVMVVFLPLARIERRDATISVDALFTVLGPGAQRAVNLFVAVFSTVVYGGLAWVTWLDAVHQHAIRAYVFAVEVQLPVWPGYFMLPVALALAAIVTLSRIFELVAGLHAPERDAGVDGLTGAAYADRDGAGAGRRS